MWQPAATPDVPRASPVRTPALRARVPEARHQRESVPRPRRVDDRHSTPLASDEGAARAVAHARHRQPYAQEMGEADREEVEYSTRDSRAQTTPRIPYSPRAACLCAVDLNHVRNRWACRSTPPTIRVTRNWSANVGSDGTSRTRSSWYVVHAPCLPWS